MSNSNGEAWATARFGEVTSIANGMVDPKLDEYSELLHIGPENIQSGTGRVSGLKTAKDEGLISGKYLFNESAIVFSKIRPNLNKVCMPDFVGLCSADTYPIWVDQEKLDRSFLYQHMLSPAFVRHTTAMSARTGLPKINRTDLNSIRLPIPPLPEQQKIAAILSTWDRAIELTEKLIAAKQKRKQALMQKLLTGTVRFADDAKFGEWRVTKLGSVATKVGSGITPRGGQSTYLASGVPFIRSQNVLSGKLDLTDIAYLSEEQHSQMANSQVQPLDVLLNITGASIGRCAKVPAGFPTANVNQHVCIIRPMETLDPDYLSNLLNSWFGQKLVFQSQAGGNREGLNYEQIRSFKFLLPPIAEQRRIGEVLATSDAEIDVLYLKVDRLKDQKKGLMQQLLTGKVRVNVDAETVKG